MSVGSVDGRAVRTALDLVAWPHAGSSIGDVTEIDSGVNDVYDPLPFGPDLPRRDLYRLLAMGREVGALDLWYEGGSQTHERRGNTLAREIEQIVP